MSDPKVKPSIAARELAMRLFASDHGMSHMDKLPQFDTLRSRHQIVVEKYEAIVQSALGDLLEKAEDCANAGRHGLPESQHELIEAMKPWKTTI